MNCLVDIPYQDFRYTYQGSRFDLILLFQNIENIEPLLTLQNQNATVSNEADKI